VPPPWTVPPLGGEVVLGAEFDAAGLEQAASSSERAATAATAPRPWSVFDICTEVRN
jgi:hypothetical protein